MTEANVFYTAAERLALHRVLMRLRSHSLHCVAIDDGGGREGVPEGTQMEEIVHMANQVEECTLFFSTRSASGRRGSIFIVWGNSPSELIADHSTSISGVVSTMWDEIVESRPDTAQALLDGMKRLREKGPELRHLGICWNLQNAVASQSDRYYAYGAVSDLAVGWAKHRGNPAFPVPLKEDGLDLTDIWDRDTQQGRDRWELLDWIIERAEESL